MMADPLYELLLPHFTNSESPTSPSASATSAATADYLLRLSTLQASALTTTESDSLNHTSQSLLRSLQALARRSFRSINTSVEALEYLQHDLPQIASNTVTLQTALPALDENAAKFSEKYSKATENPVLDRRRRLMRLGDNVDRLSDLLELPSLLSSTITASTGSATASTGSSISYANAHYASALDLYAHIRRLQKLYPESELVKSIGVQAEDAMRAMTTSLIAALRSQSLKLAGGMRLIGLLRRVAPDLDDRSNTSKAWNSGASEGSLGALFIVCRLTNLVTTLDALQPLKDLADQETEARKVSATKGNDKGNSWSAGQQTERYLKRYIEIFREQCFAIISTYKSIFPTSLPGSSANVSLDEPSLSKSTRPSLTTRMTSTNEDIPVGKDTDSDPLQILPSALSTLTLHIVDLLIETIRVYLPNVRDQSSRDSLLTQVLYCAASLGRLGGDFGMMLAGLDEEFAEADEDDVQDQDQGVEVFAPDPEWVAVMKRHRVAAGRLELLAAGGGGRAVSGVSLESGSPVRETASPV